MATKPVLVGGKPVTKKKRAEGSGKVRRGDDKQFGRRGVEGTT